MKGKHGLNKLSNSYPNEDYALDPNLLIIDNMQFFSFSNKSPKKDIIQHVNQTNSWKNIKISKQNFLFVMQSKIGKKPRQSAQYVH
jgi:hypothetical protein